MCEIELNSTALRLVCQYWNYNNTYDQWRIASAVFLGAATMADGMLLKFEFLLLSNLARKRSTMMEVE